MSGRFAASKRPRPISHAAIESQSAAPLSDWPLRGRASTLNGQTHLRSVDRATPSGMLMRTIMAGLAEFERNLIGRRAKPGLAGGSEGAAPRLVASQRPSARRRRAY